jgi:hypothetical protein
MTFADSLAYVWPLSFILVALFVLRQIGEKVEPVFTSVIGGLSKNASSNAVEYAKAIGFGLSASFSAFYDVFGNTTAAEISAMSWHGYAGLWTKVLNPFLVAILAYASQSNFKKPTGATTPPFSTPPTQ